MLKISFERVTPGEILGREQPGWHLAVLRQGSYVELSSELCHEASPGCVRLSAPGYRHHLYIEADGAICFTVQAQGRFWSSVFAHALPSSAAPMFATTRVATPIEPVLEPADIGLFLARPSAADTSDSAIREAKSLLDANASLSLARLAHDAGLPRGRFAARFRSLTGFRPAEYRMARRAAEARRRIIETPAPLREIAADVGFSDQSHMTNALRAVFGVTPRRLRDAL